MDPLSHRSPKTSVRTSPIHGRGLFASAPISRGGIVAIKGGSIIGRDRLAHLRPQLGAAEIQIADDLYICPTSEEEREGSMIFSNHSCEPNLGVAGQIVFVALRDIAPGEELTHDWAMTDDDDSSIQCACGATTCRGVVTGKDWQLSNLREKYRGYFSWYIEQKQRGLRGAT